MILKWAVVFFPQGQSQFVHLEFESEVDVSELRIQFQGGFAGKDCWIESVADNTEVPRTLVKACDFYPEDINSVQISF